jgi:hypothetical protein
MSSQRVLLRAHLFAFRRHERLSSTGHVQQQLFRCEVVTFDAVNCASIMKQSFGMEPEQLTAGERKAMDSLDKILRNIQ